MPEGHTIHRLAARHRELFAGAPVRVASPQGRFEAGAAILDGRILCDTDAYGKHLLHHYVGELTLHVHLGLYGKFRDGQPPAPQPLGEVRLQMIGPRGWLELRGPTACEVLDPPGVAALRARLGPDPLRPDADPALAYRAIKRSSRPIITLLMDQSIVAGAGLIYATEALFRAGLRPTLPGTRLTRAAWTGLWADLVMLMRAGVEHGRIDTVHDVHMPEVMGRPPRVDAHGGEVYIYRRTGQPCLICDNPVRAGELGGRNLYWCATCQPARPRATPRRAASAAAPPP